MVPALTELVFSVRFIVTSDIDLFGFQPFLWWVSFRCAPGRDVTIDAFEMKNPQNFFLFGFSATDFPMTTFYFCVDLSVGGFLTLQLFA